MDLTMDLRGLKNLDGVKIQGNGVTTVHSIVSMNGKFFIHQIEVDEETEETEMTMCFQITERGELISKDGTTPGDVVNWLHNEFDSSRDWVHILIHRLHWIYKLPGHLANIEPAEFLKRFERDEKTQVMIEYWEAEQDKLRSEANTAGHVDDENSALEKAHLIGRFLGQLR